MFCREAVLEESTRGRQQGLHKSPMPVPVEGLIRGAPVTSVGSPLSQDILAHFSSTTQGFVPSLICPSLQSLVSYIHALPYLCSVGEQQTFSAPAPQILLAGLIIK